MFNKLKQAIRILRSGDFMRNPNAVKLNETDRRALLVGLINSEQLTAYCDSLTTGLPRERVVQGLSEAWDIDESGSAVSVLEWILNEGHRAIYDVILPMVKIEDEDKRKEAVLDVYNALYQQAIEPIEDEGEVEEIKERFHERVGTAFRFIGNLKACIEGQGKDGFVAFNDENMSGGILGWDLGRLVTVSRLAQDAGYIDEPTAWNYIRKGYLLANQHYSTWKDLATAYLIGRGTWGGDTAMLGGLYVIAKKSVDDDKSPWRDIALK